MRSKKNGVFLVACLTILAALLWSHSVFVEYFALNGEDKFRADAIAGELRRERFDRAMAEARLRDFAQTVAAALPPEESKKFQTAGIEVQNLSSAVREPASIPLDLSGVVVQKAKRLFSEKKYRDAAKEFETVVNKYPTSPNVVESYFFLGESAFLTGDEAKAIEVTDLMVSQFPGNELTGFMLLRLGQINERNSRAEEASEIYRTVSKSFRNPALIEQARRLSKALDLE